MRDDPIVVLDGARTAIGSFGRKFKDGAGFELGAVAVQEALMRAGVEDSDISGVVMGCIAQVGPDAYNARRVAVTTGLRKDVPAYTVNRLRGSGHSRRGRQRWRCVGTISTSLCLVVMSR